MNIRNTRIAQALLALAAAVAFVGLIPMPDLPMLASVWGDEPVMFSALLLIAAIVSLQFTFWTFGGRKPSVRRVRWSFRAFGATMVASLTTGLSNSWFAFSSASYYHSENLIHVSGLWFSIGWWTAAPTLLEAAAVLWLAATTIWTRVRRGNPTVVPAAG